MTKLVFIVLVVVTSGAVLADPLPLPLEISSRWQIADATKISASRESISKTDYVADGWLNATVPGTVLTSLVNDAVYPEPLYGENNRPNIIPDTLCRHDWLYRTVFTIPENYAGKTVWLNFDGINYAAEVWVNGAQVGKIKGAFIRGVFDITPFVKPGKKAALAVQISPEPTPGETTEHTIRLGTGNNFCVTPADGPTFLCTIGWDWLPTIRDRDSGIWQKVFLSASGPALIEDPLVTTDLPLPRIDSADIQIQATLKNTSSHPVHAVLKGNFDDIAIEQPADLAANGTQVVKFDPTQFPQLRIANPKLWWPNGFGPQNLHTLNLVVEVDHTPSDSKEINFGIRKITYTQPPSDNVALTVNGVPVFAKGGDWGLDEALKRIPRERLEAQIKMHQLANYTIIRNWVGQSTSSDFYDLCDKYGLLVWDEFFEPSGGAPNPTDFDTYMANVKDKILRFRNHPCIAIWCARNEGNPPKEINDAIEALMKDLEPMRLYQPNSKDGRGVRSGGPYGWREPERYYEFPQEEAFKTEIGSVSIPTIESIQGMMPQKDWGSINDDWAEHDLTRGAQERRPYLNSLEERYGKAVNMADFVRKGQLMNYDAFRAMYEGRFAKLFRPETGAITWMSNPAQPSFVWQIYHYDLEPNSSFFAVRKACEQIHVQLNEKEGVLEVVNQLPTAVSHAALRTTVYNFDGSIASDKTVTGDFAPSSTQDVGPLQMPATPGVHFVKLELNDSDGKSISSNFYWRGDPSKPDDLTQLDQLPPVVLGVTAVRHDNAEKALIDVSLKNPGPSVAILVHLQLHRARDSARVLPVYYSDNYVSLAPNEEKKVTIDADGKSLGGDALVMVDGWNIAGVKAAKADGVSVALNDNAQVDHWPKNGFKIDYGTPESEYHINCGGPDLDTFENDDSFGRGLKVNTDHAIDVSAQHAAPEAVYKTARNRKASYIFPMKPLETGHTYTVRLHFAELVFDAIGKRRFDVNINGKTVIHALDIFQEAGGMYKAVVKEFPGVVPDADGNIEIDPRPCPGEKDTPCISGIEILPN